MMYALQAYLTRSPDHVETFLHVLGAKTMEFMRKCSRLMQIYITPYIDPTLKSGIRMRNKTPEEASEENRFLSHKRQLWPLIVQPCLRIVSILAEKSAMFTYFCLTGVRHPGEKIPAEEVSPIDP